jgi:threonine dehydrogenase-like Zn-dependent dehydrogenase
MNSLWLDNQKLEYFTTISEPIPASGEALIRVSLAGICATDLELMRGYYQFTGIPGHEFVGRVVCCPSNDAWIGKRVVGEINIACGSCGMCASGLPRHCEHRKTLGIRDWNGSFCEYLVLPLTNLHEVPGHVSDRAAVFCEPLAAACEILEQTQINKSDRLLLIGGGKLGQLVAQVVQITGCQMDVLARYPRQRQLLADRNIHCITEDDLGSGKYDIVIEATGSPDGFALASKNVRPRGKIILKSTYNGDTQVHFSALVVDEITLLGSRCGPFERALDLLSGRLVDPLPLIEADYSLMQGVKAFEHAARPGTMKIILEISE